MIRILLSFLFLSQLASAQSYVSLLDINKAGKNSEDISEITAATIPFTLIEGMVLVEATKDQQKGNYIIDTGASALVINEKPNQHNSTEGQGISQQLLSNEVLVKDFSWSGLRKKNIDAFKVDISHLEKVSGKPIAGILGYEILKEIELLLDYETQTIQVKPSKTIPTATNQPIAVIPFTMQAHLPVIKVKIGKKKLRLALDTASETNILDKKMFKKLNANLLVNTRMGEVQGLDQKIKQVPFAEIQTTTVNKLSFDNMSYLFTDLSHLKSESGLYIDGLLGYPFFKQGKISINYQEKKIYVWAK